MRGTCTMLYFESWRPSLRPIARNRQSDPSTMQPPRKRGEHAPPTQDLFLLLWTLCNKPHFHTLFLGLRRPTSYWTVEMDLESIPPITGAWGALTLATAVLEHTHVISSFQLFYTPSLVFRKYQVWRLLTTFLYFGPLGLDFIFHLFFFMRYSRMLEENSFGGRAGGRAAYVMLLLFAASCLLILSPLTAQPFLGSPLAFVLVYIWSRRNRHVRLSLFGLLVVTAPYLPWSLVIFGWLLHGKLRAVVGDISGIAVGHLCKCTMNPFLHH